MALCARVPSAVDARRDGQRLLVHCDQLVGRATLGGLDDVHLVCNRRVDQR